jgi:hypothetical protein
MKEAMMDPRHLRNYLLACGLAVAWLPLPGLAQQNSGAANSDAAKTAPQEKSAPRDVLRDGQRDGSHDFDFEIGAWKTHVARLVHPLSGSTTWAEYDGTSIVRTIWDGRANLLELEVTGPSGHIEGLSLRLYNPDAHQWSLNFASSAGGSLAQPTIGEFKNGRGEFYDQETFNGRAILVRFVISDITPDSCHFEQAFSDDGGKTWEVNWIATDTRMKDAPGAADGSGAGSHVDGQGAAEGGALGSARDNSPGATKVASPAASAVHRQSMSDAWWTGPMLAPNATTLPRGHLLVEPYLYDVVGTHSNGFGSLTYINYGLVDRFTVGVIPTAGYDKVSNGPSSAGVGLGDWTVQGQFRVTKFEEGGWVPTTSVVVQETFPTGKFDRLGAHPSDGLGGGAYTTTAAFYSQTYFWLPTGRILRARLDLSEAFPTSVGVQDVSVFGTAAGFRGNAAPGRSFLMDAAGEYSVTQHWVLALDVTCRHTGNTRTTGMNVPDPASVVINSGTSDAVGFAPAVEYNLGPRVGVLVGARVIAIGHNTPVTVTPAVAINIVH